MKLALKGMGSLLLLLFAVSARAVPLADVPACAGSAGQVELECRSWTEIESALKAGLHTVILPAGGTEQSGPYMAVGKHNVRARWLADHIAATLTEAHIPTLVAPVLRYVPEGNTSPRTSHMRFAGTLSVPLGVFLGVVEGAAESLKAQGFTIIVLLGDHGGTQNALEQAAHVLNQRWKASGSKARVLYVPDYYRVVPGAYAGWLRQQGHNGEVGMHAELSDTSLMMAVDPSLVHQNALVHAPPPSAAQGIYGGDPRRASAELGEKGLELQEQAVVGAVQKFEERVAAQR